MNIKASGRSALIIAAGFWICVSGPLQAAEDADGGAAAYEAEAAAGPPVALNKFTKKSRHWKRVSSQRKSVKAASRDSTERAKASEKKISEKKKTLEADAALNDDGSAPSLPPSIANANAQMASADGPAGSASALSSQARDRLQVMAANQSDLQAQPGAANTELVAADELNEVDRALSENTNDKDKAPSATLAMAVAQAPAQPQAAVVSTDDSAWNQTSVIGKIFIAFGGLLTLASAARMFMA
jgi:chromosome segregation ATPase